MWLTCNNAISICIWGLYRVLMADIEVNNPDVYRKDAPVDDRGRVSIGNEYAGKTVTIVVEVNDDQ